MNAQLIGVKNSTYLLTILAYKIWKQWISMKIVCVHKCAHVETRLFATETYINIHMYTSLACNFWEKTLQKYVEGLQLSKMTEFRLKTSYRWVFHNFLSWLVTFINSLKRKISTQVWTFNLHYCTRTTLGYMYIDILYSI